MRDAQPLIAAAAGSRVPAPGASLDSAHVAEQDRLATLRKIRVDSELRPDRGLQHLAPGAAQRARVAVVDHRQHAGGRVRVPHGHSPSPSSIPAAASAARRSSTDGCRYVLLVVATELCVTSRLITSTGTLPRNANVA